MNYKKFFRKLTRFYTKGVKGTNCCVKYYLQQHTFSYEIHDSTKVCYSPISLLKESITYYGWDSPAEMKNILEDIVSNAKLYKDGTTITS